MNIKINGKNVNIRTGGVNLDKKNKALILLHGAGMDGSIWQLQTRYLANKGIRSLAIDLPGHGFSDPPTLKSIKNDRNFVQKNGTLVNPLVYFVSIFYFFS